MIKMLKKFDACREAIEFAENYENFESAWQNCHRGDWMLWIAQKVGVNHRKLILAKALCAETVIHLMRDKRSINAVQTAKDYGNNKATRKDLDTAAYAAGNAVVDANVAAVAADIAAAVAADAADAADAAAAHAAVAAAAAAKENNQKQTADICREILTDEISEKITKSKKTEYGKLYII